MSQRVNTTELAAHLFLTKTRIKQLTDEGVLERKASDGTYDIDQSRRAYLRWLGSNRRASRSKSASRVQDARARQIEITTARMEGELCSVAEALSFLDETIGPLKSELQGFAARVTRDLELRQKIELEIFGVLERASDRAAAEATKLREPGAK